MSDPSFRPPSNLGAPKEKMGGGEKSTLGCLALIFAPIALIIVAIVVGGLSSGDSADDPDVQRIEAIRYCEDAVLDRLKAPSTAVFDTDATGSNPFTVTGTVDSENGFGAMLRGDLECRVTISGDSFTVAVTRLG